MTLSLQNAARPSLLRVLAAIFYDLWLIAAIWMLGVIVDTFVRSALTGSASEGSHLLLWAWWAISPFLFYLWFWTHGGQTLGMRAWRIRLVDAAGEPVNAKAALRRSLFALLSWAPAGLGFVWILFDAQRNSWHDRLSDTYLVLTAKNKA